MEAAVPAEIGRLWWLFQPGKEWGKEEGLTGAGFVAGDGAGRRPAAARSGGRRCRPLELRLR
jgi:hypothetical protein